MKHVNHILLHVVTHWHVASLKQPEQRNNNRREDSRGGRAEITGLVSQLSSILTER